MLVVHLLTGEPFEMFNCSWVRSGSQYPSHEGLRPMCWRAKSPL